MQLNPSTDFYDEYEDEDENDDIDESTYDNNEEGPQPAPVSVAREPVDDEEEDMGYDEDDERIAITVERPKELPTHQEPQRNHRIEEGSPRKIYDKSSSDGNRFVVDSQNIYQRKEQNLWTENDKGDEVDSREGSGNFANDDEDDDDDGVYGEDASEEDSRKNNDFFNSKRSKAGSRYFRKNNNDAIKIISTPLGKVGIVYQQSPNEQDHNTKQENTDKKTTTFTDFDALSPDPDSSRRLASSHPKITPVLTPDGKVALLYRGDSENTKYEPIRNLTHKFHKNNSSSTEKTGTINESFSNRFDDNNESRDSETEESEEGSENKDNNLNSSESKITDAGKISDNKHRVDEHRTQNPIVTSNSATIGTFGVRPPDSILPMINRPLSEVLGIKKNQFKQFRVKDISTTTTESTPRQLTGADADSESNLHFLTKVNLADYPTSTRSRNFDFDFSRDNTMLDERKRNKELNQESQTHNNVDATSHSNTIANDEVLSKTEVVNLAIIPHFDEEFERLRRLRDHENRRHHRQRHRLKQSEEELSGIHCIMQAMMGIAAISTVFGMLGTFFKQRILDQIRLMHW